MMRRMGVCARIIHACVRPWTERKLWITMIGVSIMQQVFWVWVYYQYSLVEQWRFEGVAARYDHLQNWIGSLICSYVGVRTVQNMGELMKTGKTTGQSEPQ